MKPAPVQAQTISSSWLPRLFILLMAVLAFGLLLQPLGDPDVYIHLRDGRHWVANHFQADQEPFAYTIPEKSIEKVEVLFRVGIYLAYQAGGYGLLTVLKSLAMTAALFLLGLLVYRRWSNLGLVALLLALAMLAPQTRIMPERPYVVTYLLLPLLMLWLDDFRRAGPKPDGAWKKLWIIPALMVPWANLHPGFMVAFGFLGAQMLDDALSYWRTQDRQYGTRVLHLGGITLAAFLAGAINPIGFSLYAFVLETTASQDFMKYLTEWAPPQLAREPLFFSLLVLTWLAQLIAWRKARLAELLPLVAFSYLALKSYRNMPLFLIAALPPLAGNLQYLWLIYWPRATLSPRWRSWSLIGGSTLLLSLILWVAGSGFGFKLGEIPHMYPQQGLAWLQAHPINGRLLTHDIWGGYVGWKSQGRVQIFIDGRFPLFGEKLYADYRKMIWGDAQWCDHLLRKYNIQGLLISPKNEIKLYQALWKSGEWALIYWDDDCLLYARRNAANHSVIEPFQYQALDPKKSPYFNPAHPEAALQEARRAAEIAPHAYLPSFFVGELSLRAGHLDAAREAFETVLKKAPRHAGSLFNLGMIAKQDQRLETAEHYFRAALRSVPRTGGLYGRVCYLMAETVKANPARRSEALRWARRAQRALPQWPEAGKLVRELETLP